jgi:hypothetical protein
MAEPAGLPDEWERLPEREALDRDRKDEILRLTVGYHPTSRKEGAKIGIGSPTRQKLEVHAFS